MLKIKFNINEFKIIFLRRFEGKNERKRISFSLYRLQRPLSCFSVSFLLQRLFFFSVSALFFLLQRPLFFSPTPHFFFSLDLLPFFFSQKYFFSPKRFSAQKSLLVCGSAPHSFLLFFLFQRFFFFLVLFSAPTFVSVQPSFLFLFFLPFFSFQFTCCPFFQPKNIFFNLKQFSLQPKTIFFFCVCLLLFYLNKSSFSSNLQ